MKTLGALQVIGVFALPLIASTSLYTVLHGNYSIGYTHQDTERMFATRPPQPRKAVTYRATFFGKVVCNRGPEFDPDTGEEVDLREEMNKTSNAHEVLILAASFVLYVVMAVGLFLLAQFLLPSPRTQTTG